MSRGRSDTLYESSEIPVDDNASELKIKPTETAYQVGDVILFKAKSGSLSDSMIAGAQKLRNDCKEHADIVHAAIVVAGGHHNVQIAHFVNGGFQIEPLATSHYNDHIRELYRPTPDNQKKLQITINQYSTEYGKSELGESKKETSYGHLKVIASFFKIDTENSNHKKTAAKIAGIKQKSEEFCSSFICRCFKLAGIESVGHSTYVLPGALKSMMQSQLSHDFTRVAPTAELKNQLDQDAINAIFKKVEEMRDSLTKKFGLKSSVDKDQIEVLNEMMKVTRDAQSPHQVLESMLAITKQKHDAGVNVLHIDNKIRDVASKYGITPNTESFPVLEARQAHTVTSTRKH